MKRAKLLVIESDPETQEAIRHAMALGGCEVVTCSTGSDGLQAYRTQRPDVVVVDMVLPDMSGLDVCRAIRRQSNTGLILMTEADDEVDSIVGLELGADDSLRKPLRTRELLARVKALLRRTAAAAEVSDRREASGIEMAHDHYEVRVDGRLLRLSPNEYRLLAALMEQPGQVVPMSELARTVSSEHAESANRSTVWVYIRRLRAKIERNVYRPERLVTVRGAGYKVLP